jgi:hypothetical protein
MPIFQPSTFSSILQQLIEARISPQTVEHEPEVEFAVEEDGARNLAGGFQGCDGFVVVAEDEIGDGDVQFAFDLEPEFSIYVFCLVSDVWYEGLHLLFVTFQRMTNCQEGSIIRIRNWVRGNDIFQVSFCSFGFFHPLLLVARFIMNERSQ